ncbi:MAG: hypothetical protein Q7U36_04705 [bacterium]|nr:hypothetical protein [bacterium]
MFDFTKEIKLEPKSFSLYRKLQILLYLSAIFLAIFLSYLIIFPHKYFFFSFLTPTSPKNTIDEPHFTNQKNNELFFDTNILDSYSTAKIILNLPETSKDDPINISLGKSYASFLYNTGDPIGFKDGSLLKNKNDYYFISDGQLRKFSSLEILTFLGYSEKQFQEVADTDLIYNKKGDDILKNNTYPNATLFQIDNNFYIMENQQLKKFVSDQAFLSNYTGDQALKKDITFLNNYPASENLAGFSDGTLVSNDISVYIISQNKIYPIDNPLTFESNGYHWEDVLPIGSDELSLYEKDKLFNIKSPHPNGTVYKTIENSTYYLVRDGQKHLLPSEKIARSWLGKNPILVSEKSLSTKVSCNIQKQFSWSNAYECQMPLGVFSEFAGFDYQFNITSANEIKINTINIDCKKNINLQNFKDFIKTIIERIRLNYV